MECRVQGLMKYWGRKVEQLYETEKIKHTSIISNSTPKDSTVTILQNRIIAFPDLINLESRLHKSFDKFGISVFLDLFNPSYDQVNPVPFKF